MEKKKEERKDWKEKGWVIFCFISLSFFIFVLLYGGAAERDETYKVTIQLQQQIDQLSVDNENLQEENENLKTNQAILQDSIQTLQKENEQLKNELKVTKDKLEAYREKKN